MSSILEVAWAQCFSPARARRPPPDLEHAQYTYNEVGRVKTLELRDGNVATLASVIYDGRGRETLREYVDAGALTLYQQTTGYDAQSNVDSESNGGNAVVNAINRDYTHDALNRLTLRDDVTVGNTDITWGLRPGRQLEADEPEQSQRHAEAVVRRD